MTKTRAAGCKRIFKGVQGSAFTFPRRSVISVHVYTGIERHNYRIRATKHTPCARTDHKNAAHPHRELLVTLRSTLANGNRRTYGLRSAPDTAHA